MSKNRRIRGTSPEVEQAARRLRQNLTPAETLLWQALRNKQLAGLKFRCQHPVGNFILDFYCPSLKLVIEVDGAIHHDRIDYDTERSQKLSQHGYQVLRFSNAEIINHLPQVLSKIHQFAIANPNQ